MKVYYGAPSARAASLKRGAALTVVAVAVFGGGTLAFRSWHGSDDAKPLHRPLARPTDPLPVVLPASDPAALRPVAPEKAEAINAATPVSAVPNPAASPWNGRKAGDLDLVRSVDCLAAAVYYEAASEPVDGQEAVAQVVLNRVRHPAFPHTVCGTVFEGAERTTGCQFSFTCDGSLSRTPSKTGWARARAIAAWALAGHVYRPVGWATHYHADYVVPYWSSTLLKVATVGRHIFYRWNGDWGTRRAFYEGYAGIEPDAYRAAVVARLGLDADAALLVPANGAAPAVITARPVLDNMPAGRPAEPAAGMASVPAAQRWVLGNAPPATTANQQAPAGRP